ncbi:hypothetical protein F4776DRAFT_43209 [Hypoxylon sp. NC0597]|nr:hypothetical protein F4776DRAFT_43209 [Hypoxylon sp. NC0597]
MIYVARLIIPSTSKYHPAIMFLMLDILSQGVFFREAIRSGENLVKSFAKYCGRLVVSNSTRIVV